ITAIAEIRLSPLGEWGPRLEIVVSYGLLAVALLWVLRRRRRPLAASLATVTVAAVLSLSHSAFHFVVLTHLHNIVPLFFLWEWSRRVTSRLAGAAFRAAQLGWVVVIPAFILLGAFDGLLPPNLTLGTQIVGSAGPIAELYTPPAWREGTLPVRF